jgi:hypothetical protein
MKVFALLIVLIAAMPVRAEEEAYLVVGATILPTSKTQPKWIGFMRNNNDRFTHIPVKQAITRVKPGSYKLMHLDFQKNQRLGAGTINLKGDSALEFEVVPGKITFVGLVQVQWDGSQSGDSLYKISVVPANVVLQWACSESPEVFEALPVRVYTGRGKFEEHRIRCET